MPLEGEFTGFVGYKLLCAEGVNHGDIYNTTENGREKGERTTNGILFPAIFCLGPGTLSINLAASSFFTGSLSVPESSSRQTA